jgi:hypothetical protein
MTETFSKLTTEVDLASPLGLEMSAAFDKYVERIIKPTYPKGENIRQTSRIDDATGTRSVDWSFDETSAHIGPAVQASVDNFIQEWAAKRSLIDEDGEPGEDQPDVPMRVSALSTQTNNIIKDKILDPRTAAAIKLDVHNAGGDFVYDKKSGFTRLSIPNTATNDSGASLTDSVNADIESGNKRYLAGEITASALADGSSPADIDQRATAMVNRNYKQMMAKNRAMTPEMIKEERKAQLFNAGQRYLAEQEYEEETPDDPLVRKRKEQENAQKTQKALRTTKNVAQFAWNTLHSLVNNLVSAVSTGIGILAKTYSVVSEIGQNVRRQAMQGEQYNFSREFVESWKLRADQEKIDPGILYNAAGVMQAQFGSALHLDVGAIEKLAPYMKDNVSGLLNRLVGGMEGEVNTVKGMSLMVDTFAQDAWRGTVGTHEYGAGPQGRSAANTDAHYVLGSVNEGLGQMYAYYWHTLESMAARNRLGQRDSGAFYDTETGKDYTFKDWIDYNPLNPDVNGADSNGLTNETIDRAAETVSRSVDSLAVSLKTLWKDIATVFTASADPLVEQFRQFVTNMLSKYFPVFAMKEDQRAEYINQKSLEYIETQRPVYEDQARYILEVAGYEGDLDSFYKLVHEEIQDPKKRDDAVANLIDSGVKIPFLLENLAPLTGVQYLNEIEQNIAAEDKTYKDKKGNYVRRAYNTGTDITPAEIQTRSYLDGLKIMDWIKDARIPEVRNPTWLEQYESIVTNMLPAYEEATRKANEPDAGSYGGGTAPKSAEDKAIEAVRDNKISIPQFSWMEHTEPGVAKAQYALYENAFSTLLNSYNKSTSTEDWETAATTRTKMEELWTDYTELLDNNRMFRSVDTEARIKAEESRKFARGIGAIPVDIPVELFQKQMGNFPVGEDLNKLQEITSGIYNRAGILKPITDSTPRNELMALITDLAVKNNLDGVAESFNDLYDWLNDKPGSELSIAHTEGTDGASGSVTVNFDLIQNGKRSNVLSKTYKGDFNMQGRGGKFKDSAELFDAFLNAPSRE